MTDKWCGGCENQTWCRYINPYIGHYCPGYEAIINNKSPRREELVSDVITGHDIEARDYKDVLVEMGESRDAEHATMHDRIRAMPETDHAAIRLKGIACMLWFGMSAQVVQRVLGMKKSRFYEICKELVK